MATLDYSRAGPPDDTAGSLRGRALILACVVCTLLIAQTCVRIEILNARAGGILPRQEPGKWRVGWANEPSWRRVQARRTGDPTLETRPLTPDERAQMLRETTQERFNGQLRDLVGSFGCLQYLLVPLTGVLALRLILIRRPTAHRLIGAVCLLISGVGGAMMLHRAYFTSLGW